MIAATRTPWTPLLLWLMVPGVVGAIAWWWGIGQFISGRVDITTNLLQNVSLPAFTAAVGLAVWVGATLIMTYLLPWRSSRYALGAVLGLPVFFFFPVSLWTSLAFVLTAAGLIWAMQQTWSDLHNRLTLQPTQTLNIGLSGAVLGILIAVSVLSYQHVTDKTISPAGPISELASNLVTTTEHVLPHVYKGYRPTMTVDELIGSQLPGADTILQDIHFDSLSTQAAKQQALNQKLNDIGLNSNDVHLDLNQDSFQLRNQLSAQLEKFRQDAIDQTRSQVGKQLGVFLKGDETVHLALTSLVDQKLTTTFGKYVNVVPIILAIGVFLLLRLFSFIYTWGIVAFGWALYRFLRVLGVVSIETTTVPAQHLDWKR